MSTNYRAIFRTVVLAALIFTAHDARGGLLYVLNQQSGGPNQIYGYAVNEVSGALSLLGNFPMPTGGNGAGSSGGQIAIDRANQRLYVINDGSDTITAFAIAGTGQLTPLPFSPITLPAGSWGKLAVHPSGSPLIVNDTDATPVAASFVITATSAVPAVGSPFSLGTGASKTSSTFSRDGNFFYAGGGSAAAFAGFSVNPSSGVLTPLPGSPFNSGAVEPSSYATDAKGRLFMASATVLQLRAFTTTNGIPTGVTGNPFSTAIGTAGGSVLDPTERYLYVADMFQGRVGGFEIAGDGAATTLTAIGQPVTASAPQTNAVVMNGSGSLLFATNNAGRNITTYDVDVSSGQLIFDNVQPGNTLGTTGTITGLAYIPQTITVTNAADSGAGSLRQAIAAGGSVQSGTVITFDPVFFSTPQTIELTSGQLVINSHLSIVGPGAGLLTIRNTTGPSSTGRVFNVLGGTVDIGGMTIAGGNVTGSGGGLLIGAGIVTVRACTITGNNAAAFGGAVHNNGATLNIINSTISGNRATGNSGGGGGIDSPNGTLIITGSTISGNIKTGGASGNGGGIFADSRTTITNSTITRNSAPNGAGGLAIQDDVTTVRNTIIAGNLNNTTIPDVTAAAGTSLISGGFNLIGNRGAATGFIQTGDQTGTGGSPLDPGLVNALAFKGGPTPVHMLLPTSPAVDKGSNSNITSDQRGSSRPFDTPGVPNTADASDIGAVERDAQESIFTAPFDFDGDGKTDIGIFRPLSNAQWWINQSSTGATFAATFGTGSVPIAPADYTGDGKCDIAIWREANGTWFVLRSEDFSFFAFPFGSDGDIPVPADFDGDGKADAAVFRPSAATWFISNSSGGTTILQFGAGSDRPVPADYDGDGRVDIAIYRPTNGQWWMNRSTSGVIAVTFGVGSDKQVQGDYTGDGKSDVAFWQPSTGTWFVLRSEDFSYFAFPFGAPGDVPAPGDYDGDGKHDGAVFRPSAATWFLQRSTAGTISQPFGVSTDRPIPNAFVR